ncbi:MAG: 2-hydroxyacid dehydrogenase [Verrucomicrobiota bacterium]
MKIAVFSSKSYDRRFLASAMDGKEMDCTFFEPRLTVETAPLARDHDVVCAFVHDIVSAEVIDVFHSFGIKLLALRCAGFNNVDLKAAAEAGMTVMRVPAYSPYAVAEHACGMILELNRKYYRAYNRIRENNFSLEGLVGFDLHGKTVGVIGTGIIGECFIRIMQGFGCHVLAHDVYEKEELKKNGVKYVPLEDVFAQSDIISLHCPLLESTKHLIRAETITQLKKGVMLINTSRGGLIDTPAAIDGIKSGIIGHLGLDVYEEEEGVFFEDLSSEVIIDDNLMRLTTFPNVLITSHQAFFTKEALMNIAETTVKNILDFQSGADSDNVVTL